MPNNTFLAITVVVTVLVLAASTTVVVVVVVYHHASIIMIIIVVMIIHSSSLAVPKHPPTHTHTETHLHTPTRTHTVLPVFQTTATPDGTKQNNNNISNPRCRGLFLGCVRRSPVSYTPPCYPQPSHVRHCSSDSPPIELPEINRFHGNLVRLLLSKRPG